MYQVVVLPPDGPMRGIEELRRLHDPAFHRVGAHVPLLPAFDADERTLLARFDSFDAPAAIDVEFGAPAAVGDALVLPVARGGAEISALRASLAALLLGPLDAAPAVAPALRVGLFGGAAEMELARRALATLPAPAAWRATEVVLLIEDVRGLWHEVRRRALGRPRGLTAE